MWQLVAGRPSKKSQAKKPNEQCRYYLSVWPPMPQRRIPVSHQLAQEQSRTRHPCESCDLRNAQSGLATPPPQPKRSIHFVPPQDKFKGSKAVRGGRRPAERGCCCCVNRTPRTLRFWISSCPSNTAPTTSQEISAEWHCPLAERRISDSGIQRDVASLSSRQSARIC